MSFGRKLQRRNQGKLGTAAVRVDDHTMLRVGKRLVDQETNVFEIADEEVIVVVDVRDAIGATWACIESGLLETAGDDDELGRRIVADFVASVVGHGKTANPHPFVAFWALRTTGLLDWLRAEGFAVPEDWYATFETAPQAGNVYTILKRNGAGVLMSVDYTQIEALPAPGVVTRKG
jgi:hypothetical protein